MLERDETYGSLCVYVRACARSRIRLVGWAYGGGELPEMICGVAVFFLLMYFGCWSLQLLVYYILVLFLSFSPFIVVV